MNITSSTYSMATMIDPSFFIKKYMPESDLQHLNPKDFKLASACLFHANDACFSPKVPSSACKHSLLVL